MAFQCQKARTARHRQFFLLGYWPKLFLLYLHAGQQQQRPLRPNYTREGVAVEPYAIQTAGCDSGAAITVNHSPSPTVRAAFHGPPGDVNLFL